MLKVTIIRLSQDHYTGRSVHIKAPLTAGRGGYFLSLTQTEVGTHFIDPGMILRRVDVSTSVSVYEQCVYTLNDSGAKRDSKL